MRLINCDTLEMREFFGKNIPQYAILSHRWSDDEITFKEYQKGQRQTSTGYQKTLALCRQALEDDLHWVWIDTCCIDKRSSSELSEAINSMFQWYKRADLCYVYLSDVLSPQVDFSHVNETRRNTEAPRKSGHVPFEASEWFTRGWTLQELLAPRHKVFLTSEWQTIGFISTSSDCSPDQLSRYWKTRSLSGLVAKITGISDSVICYPSRALKKSSIAQKLSWYSDRQTTREEDQAYCLLGICDVNMPLLYGEGRKAWTRLQQELIRQSDDPTILAWSRSDPQKYSKPYGRIDSIPVWSPGVFDHAHDRNSAMSSVEGHQPILSRSPLDYRHCADTRRWFSAAYRAPSLLTFTLSNRGLAMQFVEGKPAYQLVPEGQSPVRTRAPTRLLVHVGYYSDHVQQLSIFLWLHQCGHYSRSGLISGVLSYEDDWQAVPFTGTIHVHLTSQSVRACGSSCSPVLS